MSRWAAQLWILILAVSLVFVACGRATPAPTPNETTGIVVITCGGLNADQTTDLAADLRTLPGVLVISVGERNAYLTDLAPIADAYPNAKLVFIGHSYGLRAVAAILPKLSRPAALVVLLDPVALAPGGTERIDAERVEVFYRSAMIGPITARIEGEHETRIATGDHSSICHSEEVIAAIRSQVEAL